MDFNDYYATLGVKRTATQSETKRAYRKLARKYHPDVSKERGALSRFKDVAEAHEPSNDAQRRAAYDDVAERHVHRQSLEPPLDRDSSFGYSGPGTGGMSFAQCAGRSEARHFSDLFESLFGRGSAEAADRHGAGVRETLGRDHHAKVSIELKDAYLIAKRKITLRMPVVDGSGNATLRERQLEINIPKCVHEDPHLRLAGRGGMGCGGAPEGDHYLEIQFAPDTRLRLDGTAIHFDLPISPWKDALGAMVTAATLDGSVQLSVPSGSSQERNLRLKGKGLPAKQPGNLLAVLTIAMPPSIREADKEAYRTLAPFPTSISMPNWRLKEYD